MTPVIDFHTHIFPDAIAAGAIATLAQEGKIPARLAGTKSDLLASMSRHGVEQAVICTIATKPRQFDRILAWCQEIASPRLLPFPSVHPAAPDCGQQIRAIKAAGFKGIKMHPYYQDFFLDEERLTPLYREIAAAGLILLLHTGFDIAFPRTRRADPAQLLRLTERFPELLVVASHFGAWDQWDEVRALLLGKPIYMDLSFSLAHLEPAIAREMIARHPPGYLLFGSDSPWADQGEALQLVRDLGLDAQVEEEILAGNARKLLSAGGNLYQSSQATRAPTAKLPDSRSY